MKRMDKIEYFINQAKAVAARSPCSRRKFGAIIVKDGVNIGSGYNGSARGTLNCGIDIPCIKEIADEPHNISYDYCPAVHAEENAIINSNRDERINATMFLAPLVGHGDRPCYRCRRRILNARIKDIYYIDKDGNIKHEIIKNEESNSVQQKDYVDMDNEWMLEKLEEANPNWREFLL